MQCGRIDSLSAAESRHFTPFLRHQSALQRPKLMPSFTILCLLLIAAGATLTYLVCQQAPEGHEDQSGFWEETDES